jgi:hypothetical protein
LSSPHPSPANMPKRKRPVVPQRRSVQPGSAQDREFAVDSAYPQRGMDDVVVWPDTGIFLGLGTDDDLPERFRQHFKRRIRVAGRVVVEVRGHTDGGRSTPQEDAKTTAAMQIRSAFFLGDGQLPILQLTEEDIEDAQAFMAALGASPGEAGKKHSGEAEIIALALRHGREVERRQVLLANDAGASRLAAAKGMTTRHIGDVLAELSCADEQVDAASCLEKFRSCCFVSAPPAKCQDKGVEDFACVASQGACARCSYTAPAT